MNEIRKTKSYDEFHSSTNKRTDQSIDMDFMRKNVDAYLKEDIQQWLTNNEDQWNKLRGTPEIVLEADGNPHIEKLFCIISHYEDIQENFNKKSISGILGILPKSSPNDLHSQYNEALKISNEYHHQVMQLYELWDWSKNCARKGALFNLDQTPYDCTQTYYHQLDLAIDRFNKATQKLEGVIGEINRAIRKEKNEEVNPRDTGEEPGITVEEWKEAHKELHDSQIWFYRYGNKYEKACKDFHQCVDDFNQLKRKSFSYAKFMYIESLYQLKFDFIEGVSLDLSEKIENLSDKWADIPLRQALEKYPAHSQKRKILEELRPCFENVFNKAVDFFDNKEIVAKCQQAMNEGEEIVKQINSQSDWDIDLVRRFIEQQG